MEVAGCVARFTSVLAFSLLFFDAPSADGETPPGLQLPPRGALAIYLPGPAKLALDKLEKPECQAVLLDFRDADGRLLKEDLDATGMTPPKFFASLRFVDGSHASLCDRPRVAAGANPGTPVVAICMRTFGRMRFEDPTLAADVLIHEMLHALGLPEAPLTPDAPTSEEITRQVVRRCGP